MNELEGAEADLVAKALGYVDGKDMFCYPAWFNKDGDFVETKHKWHPSTNWSQGGPIIEEYNINIMIDMITPSKQWIAEIWIDLMSGISVAEYGRTPLEAAMRAFVASKQEEAS